MWHQTFLLTFQSCEGFTEAVRDGLDVPSGGGRQIPLCVMSTCKDVSQRGPGQPVLSVLAREAGLDQRTSRGLLQPQPCCKPVGRRGWPPAAAGDGKDQGDFRSYEEQRLLLEALQCLVEEEEPQKWPRSESHCLVSFLDRIQTGALCSSEPPTQC